MGSLNPENTSKQDLNDSGCVQDASVTENGYRGLAQLLDLSDDVLLYILKYCTPRDLKALGHTCPRLGALVCDRTLWTRVDARSTPVGQLRLRWLLTHCLSPATTELKLAGYVNKHSRCLGIQDLHWPIESDSGIIRGTCVGAQGVDVEHFLLRMWYPHLPRFAVSPRWPDKEEADSKAPQKASEATTSSSGGSSGSSASSSGTISSTSGTNSGFSGTNSGYSASSGTNSGPKKDNKRGFPIVFEDNFRGNCKGPQFTLTAHLMKDLRKKCSQLTSLALEYCNIDYKTTNIRQFPRNLKKLSLRGTRCYNLPLNTSYMGKIQERLPELEYLDVSECDWFEPASLMPLSKLSSLAELYMRDCKRLTECVAYASLATRYGFRQLKVMDIRGSPLADSEISALGWLPALEELYCAPPEDFNTSSEHTHSWNDTRAAFNELDTWEIEEPEYYKVRTPEPDLNDDEDDLKDDTETAEPQERAGDVLLGNPWWSHERRIIVIQPNANRQPEERFAARQRPAEAAAPVQPQPVPQAGPAAAHQPPVGPQQVPVGPRPAPVEPQQVPVAPRPAPVAQPGLVAAQPAPVQPLPAPAQPQPGPAEPAAPQEPQPGPAGPPGEPGEPGPSKRRADPDDALDLAKRPRLEDDDDDEEMPDPPVNFPNMNAEQCPRLRERGLAPEPPNDPQNRPRFVQIRQGDVQPPMHIDVDIQRQSTIHIGSHIGYHLVSDSAILRFGRAENDNINYVHIGRNGIQAGVEPGSRPDRSTLRILSVTGYRNITDRSLQHLATAAPHLISIDFSETNVTSRGVEIFKAIRPNCEVTFSEFGRIK